jgi:hypothetical protein
MRIFIGVSAMPFPSPEDALAALQFLSKIDARKARNFLAESHDVWKHGRPTFLLFGPGGNGKSTLKLFLETFSLEGLPLDYDLSVLAEKGGSIRGRWWSEVKAFPGQKQYLEGELEKDVILKSIRDLRRPIIFLCMSYGYRSVDPQNNLSRNAPQGKEGREEEIEYAKSVLTKIPNFGFKNFTIFTVIMKQDLWWDERNEVEEFYERSRYNDVIEEFGRNRRVTHILSPVSLMRVNLRDKHRNIIKCHSSQYDDDLRKGYLALFIKKILEQVRDGGLRL